MKSNGGFTLIELILVMIIISILAGAVTLNVAGRTTEARVARAKSDLKVYETAIDMFLLDNDDNYPQALNNLVQPKKYVRQIKKDPWGNDYVYSFPGRRGQDYDLYSKGKDGQAGTEDDVNLYDIE
jgi:general secretion pathway protein G